LERDNQAYISYLYINYILITNMVESSKLDATSAEDIEEFNLMLTMSTMEL
jgi:hypothetical protein